MSQNAFDQKKSSIVGEINSIEPDLSPKGTIDELCIPIIDLINSHEDMVTTSSCSGRISVFIEGSKNFNDEIKVGGKGQGGRWLYVSHSSNNIIGWLDRLMNNELEEKIDVTLNITEELSEFVGSTRYVLYKYEPFILHVKCRDSDSASRLYNTAMSCGFRESGIGSNNIVAIRINIKLDVPIGYLNESSNELKLFVSTEYIKLLDKLTLTKFNDNAKKMDQLYKKINDEIIITKLHTNDNKGDKKESKEERRQRKIQEGLERQRTLKESGL